MDKKLFNKNYILIVFSATLFYVSAFMLNSITGRYSVDLGANKTVGGIVTSVFTLTSFFTRSAWGYTTDKKGRKRVYLTGSFLCLAASVLMIFTKNIWLLLAVRGIFGAGYSAVTTAGGTIVCDVVPEKQLAKAISFYGVTSVISQAFAPGLALALYDSNYMILAVSIAVIISFVFVSAVFISYKEKEYINPDLKFGIIEKTALPRSYVIFPFALATASVYSFVPLLAEERNIHNIGLFFAVSAATLLVGRVFNTRFLNKFGINKVYYTGNLLFVAGFIMLSMAGNIFTAVISRRLYGLGAGFIHPVVNTAAVSACKKENRGLATGTFMMSQDLGMTAGALMWGFISEKAGFGTVYITVAVRGVIMLLLYRKFLNRN